MEIKNRNFQKNKFKKLINWEGKYITTIYPAKRKKIQSREVALNLTDTFIIVFILVF